MTKKTKPMTSEKENSAQKITTFRLAELLARA